MITEVLWGDQQGGGVQEGLKQGDTSGHDSCKSPCRRPKCVTIRTQIQATVVGIEVKILPPCFADSIRETVQCCSRPCSLLGTCPVAARDLW